MKRLAILIATLTACTDHDQLPTCASLGCPLQPSGSPDAWEPCQDHDVCWCDTSDGPAECLDTNRSADASITPPRERQDATTAQLSLQDAGMARSKDDAETVKAAADAPKDPLAVESMVESEKAVAPLTAAELNALVVECCDLFASVDGRYVPNVERMTRMPDVCARIAEIRRLVDNHLTPSS